MRGNFGGKTARFASRGARVTAVDIAKNRLSRLEENLHRLNLDVKIGTVLMRANGYPKSLQILSC